MKPASPYRAPAHETAQPTAPAAAPAREHRPQSAPRHLRPNPELRALLRESGWTQAALAHTVVRLGAEAGVHLRYDRTSVAHWLRGSRPEPQVRRFVAEAFSRRLGRPVAPAELGMEPGTAGTEHQRAVHDEGFGAPGGPRAEPFPSHPADRLTALTRPVVAPPRADAPSPHPYRLALLAPTAAPAHRRADTYAAARARTTTPDEAASAREHVRFFAQQADRYGGGHIRTPLAAYLSGLVRSLRTGADGAHHRALLSQAARLSYLLARVYADEQRNGLAQRAFLTAAELATEATESTGVALARRALGTQAEQLGHVTESLALAEAACRSAPGTAAPGTRSFLYAGLAVSRAASGDAPGATSALRHAEQQLAAAPADLTTGPEAPGSDPLGAYRESALLYQSSRMRRALGDGNGALSDLRASIRTRPPGEGRARALCHAELAELLLHAGRLEEACATWQTFLDEAPLAGSGRVRAARNRVPRLLRPYSRQRCVQQLFARTVLPQERRTPR